jgi:hypothetical protein
MKPRPRRIGAWIGSLALLSVCWYLVPTPTDEPLSPAESRARASAPIGTADPVPATASVAKASSRARPEAPPGTTLAVTTTCPHCETGTPIPEAALPLTLDFVKRLAAMPGEITFPLPDGRDARGVIDMRVPGPDGEIDTISGHLVQPGPGRFTFTRERLAGVSYPLSGTVEILACDTAYRVETREGQPQLVALPADAVVCRGMAADEGGEVAELPSEHPTTMPIPGYQNGVIPLESLPGSAAVAYLDFDGEPGPHAHWGNFYAASYNFSNTRIKAIWVRVAEDFAPFNINVTTDLAVYLAAPVNSRQRCIVTPTKNAAPSAGGVANVGSFNNSNEVSCWVYNSSSDKICAETVSHELGHTLWLRHDGRSSPAETYYDGHGGTGTVSWGPIMGSAFYPNLTQWSKGEYTGASLFEDDLAIIAGSNNAVDYRLDDAGSSLATARYLEIQGTGNTVSGQGLIETSDDLDTFRFRTDASGTTTITVKTVTAGPNLDVLAEIVNSSGTVVASANPETAVDATVTVSIPAGEYLLRVSGTGMGNPATTGYTDYGSLGAYSLSGSVANAVKPDRFTLAETAPAGTLLGNVTPLLAHGTNALQFSMASGNTGGAFALDATTGQLTLATPSAINFETLSITWETPAWFELFVNVQDLANPSLNEVLRVVVHITNVNEAPVVAGGSIVIPERLNAGTQVFKGTATDPDRFDRIASFQIISGNTGNSFEISPEGVISTAVPPLVSVAGTYTLTVRVQDGGSPVNSGTATVTVQLLATPEGMEPGGTRRTLYDGISGNTLASLTGSASFPLEPDREVFLSSMADSGQGTNLGSVTRAFLIIPHTAVYTFWIGGDDTCQLLFVANGDPASAAAIATTSSATGQFQWDVSPSQKSATIPLVAGQICYIEARHKQGGSSENFSVGWSATAGAQPVIERQVIPGIYLAPHDLNYRPKLLPGTLTLFENAAPGNAFGFATSTDDLNPGQSATYAITGGNGAGLFAIRPADGRMTVVDSTLLDPATSYQVQVSVTDNGSPPLTGTGNLNISFRPAGPLLSSLHVAASPAESATTTGSGVFLLAQEVPISAAPLGGAPFQGWIGSGIDNPASLATDVVIDTRSVGIAGANFTSMSLTDGTAALPPVEASSDLTWSLLGATSTMDVVNSAVIGGAEALRIDGTSGLSRGLLGTMTSPVTLAVGDTLSLSIDAHYHEPPPTNTGGLLVGFTSSGAQDQTLSARLGTGTTPGFVLLRDITTASPSPGIGSVGILSTTASGPAISALYTAPVTIVLSVNRTTETHCTVSAEVGGSRLTSAPVQLAWSAVYDSVYIRNNGINADFTIDNVLVSRSTAKTVVASFPPPDPYPAWVAGFPLAGDAAERDSDPDGDGFSNLAEMHLGFSPVNAGSRLTLAMGSVEDGTVNLIANRLVAAGTFTLEWSDSLAGPWPGSQVLPVTADAWNVPIPAASGGPRRFYRLTYLPPMP